MTTETLKDRNGYEFTLIKKVTKVFERPYRGSVKTYELYCDALLLSDRDDAEAFEKSELTFETIDKYDMLDAGVLDD